MDIIVKFSPVLFLAVAIVVAILIIKLIHFLFTNWYTSRVLSTLTAISALVMTLIVKDNMTENDFWIIGALCASSFCLWVGPYIFQINYATAYIDFDFWGNVVFTPRETGSFFIVFAGSLAVSCVANHFLFDLSDGMFAISIPVLLILFNLFDFLRWII